MPIPASKLVYDFYRKLNSANSGDGQDYKIVDVVSYLNEGLEIWYENRMKVAESNEKLKNDLRQFIVNKHSLSCEVIDCNCCESTLPEDFYKLLSITVKACNESCCPNIEKEICLSNPQFDDLESARKTKYWRPDFKWDQMIYKETPNGLIFYVDDGTVVNSVCLNYYRKPRPIEAASLVNCSNNSYLRWDMTKINYDSDYEVDQTYSNRKVSDIAVLIAHRDSNDITGFQTQLQKILQIDQL